MKQKQADPGRVLFREKREKNRSVARKTSGKSAKYTVVPDVGTLYTPQGYAFYVCMDIALNKTHQYFIFQSVKIYNHKLYF